MNNKPIKVNANDIDKETQRLIDELAQKYPFRRPWTAKEDAILRAAYGKVPTNVIHEKILPERPVGSIEHRINFLGLALAFSRRR